MTAPTPEKIQRYRLDFQTMEAHNSTRMLPQSDGQLILYGDYMKAMKKKNADHLRHLKLAQIEVLEEASKLICKRCDSGDPFPHKKNQNPYSTAKTLCHAARIHALIAALRLEVDP